MIKFLDNFNVELTFSARIFYRYSALEIEVITFVQGNKIEIRAATVFIDENLKQGYLLGMKKSGIELQRCKGTTYEIWI